jgi:protein SMG6
MDDLILRISIWQDEHWFDRSAMLKDNGISRNPTGAVKDVLLSLKRNLRLKARSALLPRAGKEDLAIIIATGT